MAEVGKLLINSHQCIANPVAAQGEPVLQCGDSLAYIFCMHIGRKAEAQCAFSEDDDIDVEWLQLVLHVFTFGSGDCVSVKGPEACKVVGWEELNLFTGLLCLDVFRGQWMNPERSTDHIISSLVGLLIFSHHTPSSSGRLKRPRTFSPSYSKSLNSGAKRMESHAEEKNVNRFWEVW